jgi:hypothetical protein
MKWILLLLAAISFTTCTEMHQKRKAPECGKVFDLCLDNWYFDQQGQIFRSSFPGIERELLRNKECFRDLGPNSVKKLIGTPNLEKGATWYYYVSKPCLGEKGPGSSGCSYVKVSFDPKTGKTTDIGIGGSYSSP